MDLVIFSLLLLAALALLAAVIVLSRRDGQRTRPRVGSSLGLSSAKRRAWDTLRTPAPLGAGTHQDEAGFLPQDMAEIERLLVTAHAQELSAQDSRMLGVLEGLAGRQVWLVAVDLGDDEAYLGFADGTGLQVEGIGRERFERLERAVPQHAVLVDVSYTSPSVLLTFRSSKDTLTVGAARARLV